MHALSHMKSFINIGHEVLGAAHDLREQMEHINTNAHVRIGFSAFYSSRAKECFGGEKKNTHKEFYIGGNGLQIFAEKVHEIVFCSYERE